MKLVLGSQGNQSGPIHTDPQGALGEGGAVPGPGHAADADLVPHRRPTRSKGEARRRRRRLPQVTPAPRIPSAGGRGEGGKVKILHSDAPRLSHGWLSAELCVGLFFVSHSAFDPPLTAAALRSTSCLRVATPPNPLPLHLPTLKPH